MTDLNDRQLLNAKMSASLLTHGSSITASSSSLPNVRIDSNADLEGDQLDHSLN